MKFGVSVFSTVCLAAIWGSVSIAPASALEPSPLLEPSPVAAPSPLAAPSPVPLSAPRPEEVTPIVGGVGKTVPAVKLAKAPKIDGNFSPEEWAGAAIILPDDLHTTTPVNYGKPLQPTTAYIGYDKDFVYIAGVMTEPNKADIIARELIQGKFLGSEDSFKFYLGPFNNRRTGYFFKVNYNGVRDDALIEAPGGFENFNFDWDTIWYAKAGDTDEGWVVEIAIPFKSLNFDPSNPNWGVSFGRDIKRNNERIAWTSFDRRTDPESFGEWTGVSGVDQGMGLDLVPGLTFKNVKDHDTGKSSFKIEPSLDVFYKISPSMTAVITANTDFSATEVDDQVVNLSRFSLFLPEKRDFFLQDNDIFQFGDIYNNGTPFFSRRIGLDDDNMPIDILVGGKITGRIGKWNIGFLDIIQEKGGIGEEGNANLAVGRFTYDYSDRTSVGGIVTYGDPLTGQGAYTVGADFMYRNNDLLSGRTVQVSGWGQKTHRPGITGKNKALGIKLDLPSRDGAFGMAIAKRIEENFDPALGWVRDPGLNIFFTKLGYNYRPDGGMFERINTEFVFDLDSRIDGGTSKQKVEFRPLKLVTRAGDEIWFDVSSEKDNLDEEFEIVDGVIIPIGDYKYNYWSLNLETAEFRPVSVEAQLSKGDFYSGEKTRMAMTVNYQPIKYFKISGRYAQNDITLIEGDFITRIMSLRTDVAFNSEWSWITKVQYDNVSDEGGVNSRLRYNPQPGRDLYFVVNQGFEVDEETDNFVSTDREVSLKVGYTLRF
ncbi:hypothetical protein GCM10017044_16790 [Kordiimonas sediminis]|uniref:DUF5916 domain-containing protein n=1 Tax=Kordiimonas sediminis TaxID=1735581 RepID=A0A919ASD0_9PROT|nr:carbohydrate binding family 9 domain-containing protein [Kordiimonas sediminis]GHF23023.1 hypothetical protein GCM10017044_16790 [Kordiimonas sediminis]